MAQMIGEGLGACALGPALESDPQRADGGHRDKPQPVAALRRRRQFDQRLKHGLLLLCVFGVLAGVEPLGRGEQPLDADVIFGLELTRELQKGGQNEVERRPAWALRQNSHAHGVAEAGFPGQENIFLLCEVMKDRAPGNARRCCDLVERRRLVTLVEEQLQTHFRKALAGLATLAGAQSLRLFRRFRHAA